MAAVVAVETRQETMEQQAKDTIPLGEAVHQLNLNTTSDELLAEIEAQRRKAVAPPEVKTRKRSWKRFLVSGALSLSLLTNIALLASNISLRHLLSLPTKINAPAIINGTVLLSSIPDNEIVYTDFSTLVDIANGKGKLDTLVHTSPDYSTTSAPQWPVLRFKGRYFTHLWLTYADYSKLNNAPDNAAFYGATRETVKFNTSSNVSLDRFKGMDTPPDTLDGTENIQGIGIGAVENK